MRLTRGHGSARHGSRQGRRQGRGGFSFTEILFAVMILGIGFIMVAAVFPVAIKQTQETVEETTAATVARSGASYLARYAIEANFPGTAGKVVNIGSSSNGGVPFWQTVSGNLIYSTDNRYAWIPFYSRSNVNGNPAGYAQVTIIAVQNRNGTNFTIDDLKPLGSQPANLQGRPAMATFTPGGGASADTVMLAMETNQPGPSGPGANAAEGTYVIVADDSNRPSLVKNPQASCNGFVYRIGNAVSGSTTTWELVGGSDMKNARYTPTDSPPVAVHVLIVGRGYTSASSGDFSPSGPAMDIAAYSTFIQIH